LTTKWQQWMRTYSTRLQASFDSSALLEHSVTKGESREAQILDVLAALLPNIATVERNVVVIDSEDRESPSFDGVLLDRRVLPLLNKDGDYLVAMLEAVGYCFEVKSTIELAEIEDIFAKSAALGAMKRSASGSWSHNPLLSAFGFRAPNLNLAFLDFATRFVRDPAAAPGQLCILNRALFAPVERRSEQFAIVDAPSDAAEPALLDVGEDALLVYLYSLSRGVTQQHSVPSAIMTSYGADLFNAQAAFRFDADFLARVSASDEHSTSARETFKRTDAEAIDSVYKRARQAVGL